MAKLSIPVHVAVNADAAVAAFEHELRERGLLPMGDTSETVDGRTRVTLMFNALLGHIEAQRKAAEDALLVVLMGNLDSCSAELLERASVLLAQAAIRREKGEAPIAIPPSDVEKRLERLERLVDALIDGVKVTSEPVVARYTRPAASGVAEYPCDSCGVRHELDAIRHGMNVRTLVEGGDWEDARIPAGTLGTVREWSQYGGPLSIRVQFEVLDKYGIAMRGSYDPCQLEVIS